MYRTGQLIRVNNGRARYILGVRQMSPYGLQYLTSKGYVNHSDATRVTRLSLWDSFLLFLLS